MKKSEGFAGQCPIDTGGLVQFLTGIREQSPALLIGYELRLPVDRERLRDAAEKALDIYRIYRVKPALAGPDRTPVYENNPARVDVYPYDGRQHAFGRESNGYLFRVYYTDNSVLLSIHHMLTDFLGANEFLKCILLFYYRIAESDPETIRRELRVDPEDWRDPYTLYGNPDVSGFSMRDRWRNEVVIPNRMRYRKGEPVLAHEMVFPVSDFVKTSRRAATSVFPLMMWLMGKAVAKVYDGGDKVLTGAGACNYRTFFGSRTPRCFSQSFLTVLDPREKRMDLDLQLTVQRARMDLELDRDTVAGSIAARKALADRMRKNAEWYVLDQDRLDAERRADARKSTFFLTYPGHLDAGPALEPYLGDVTASFTVTRVPIVAVAYERKGLLRIRTQEIGCDNSIAPALLEIAGSCGLKGRMLGSFEQYHDSFPMEELFHG